MATLFGWSEDEISEICRVLDAVEVYSTMDWKCIASQFRVAPEKIASLDREDSPSRAFLEKLQRDGVKRKELIEMCRSAGFITAVEVMERAPLLSSEHETSEKVWTPASDSVFVEVPYNFIRKATNNFEDKSLKFNGFKIGEGGFGEVFYVKISIKGKGKFDCAAKRIKGTDKEEFDKEVEVMKRFRHPCIMPLFGVSTDGELPCIIYHYMKQGSLRTAIEKRTPLLPWQRLSIIRNVASALDYLHTKGETPLVHRDVKSDNILLDENYKAKLSDFGIIRFLSSKDKTRTHTDFIIGSKHYMAPEALRGTVSTHGDVYALGIVLLEVLVNVTALECDLKTRLDDNKLKESIPKDMGWSAETIDNVLTLANECTTALPKKRPSAKNVEDILEGFIRR